MTDNMTSTLVIFDFDDTLINTTTREFNTKLDWILLDSSIQTLLKFIKSLENVDLVILTSSRTAWVDYSTSKFNLKKTQEEIKTIRIVHVENYLTENERNDDMINHKYYVIDRLYGDKYSHYISFGDGFQELECSKRMNKRKGIVYKHVEFEREPNLRVILYQHLWVMNKFSNLFRYNCSMNFVIIIYKNTITKITYIRGIKCSDGFDKAFI